MLINLSTFLLIFNFIFFCVDSGLTFFEFSFELNPIHVSADYSVFLKLEPVKIVHDTVCWITISERMHVYNYLLIVLYYRIYLL